jgi:hypothetical protein
VCLAKNFDRDEIQQWMQSLEPEDKVKGLEAYEWKVVQSRKDKVELKIRQIAAENRRKRYEVQRLQFKEEQKIRREETIKRK